MVFVCVIVYGWILPSRQFDDKSTVSIIAKPPHFLGYFLALMLWTTIHKRKGDHSQYVLLLLNFFSRLLSNCLHKWEEIRGIGTDELEKINAFW